MRTLLQQINELFSGREKSSFEWETAQGYSLKIPIVSASKNKYLAIGRECF